MSEKPYTYTDPTTGARLTVDDKDIVIEVRDEGVYVSCPTGDDAVALVRAILAAAGNTGHAVVSREEIDEYLVTGRQIGARSMRDRAINAVRQSDDHPVHELSSRTAAVSAIRALPLLPEDDTEPDQAATRSDYDHGFADGLAMGHQSPPATSDPDLIQQVRALVKRYGAPVIAAEAARQAQRH